MKTHLTDKDGKTIKDGDYFSYWDIIYAVGRLKMDEEMYIFWDDGGVVLLDRFVKDCRAEGIKKITKQEAILEGYPA